MGSVKVPSNWRSFLHVNENKTELFHYLAQYVNDNDASGKVMINTFNDKVLSSLNNVENLIDLQPSNHEEADSRIILHVKNAAICGHKKVII